MYIPKRSTKRFCSTSCQAVWQTEQTGFNNSRFQGGYVKCECCGKEFLVGKYVHESNRRHFCSKSCRQYWYANVFSQSEIWRDQSRIRAASILKDNPVLTQTKPQIVTNNILDGMGIAYRNEEPFVYYSVDNYLPDFDLIIEVMGDYWHSSPLKYPDQINERQKSIMSRDKAKHTYLKKYHNIEVLYLWETDLQKRPDVCCELIRTYIESGGDIPNYHSFNYGLVDGALALNDTIILPRQDNCVEIAC